MINFLTKLSNAHSKIDTLIEGDKLRSSLKELTNIKDVYSFGKQKRGFFTNNLIDSFVDSQIEKNAQLEDLLQLGIGGSFGKENQWGAGLTGGKGWGEFNIGRSY